MLRAFVNVFGPLIRGLGFQSMLGGKGWMPGSRLGLCVALAFLVHTMFLAPKVRAATRPPNIVLINADDLGIGDLSCYGGKAVPTPNIDRLAAEGLRFTDGHASAATCTPSRYSMLTGKYAWREKGTGILTGDANLIIKPGTPTLASILQQAGYRTGIVGKWHLGLGKGKIDWNKEIGPGPLDLGFDSQFIIPATLDRVPCVYLEGRKVLNLDAADPIEISYYHRVSSDPTGESDPGALLMSADPQHSGTIVNGVSRIGYMSGGKSALWSDVDMPDLLAGRAVKFIEENKDHPFFLYFPLVEPHVPRIPNPRFVGKTSLGPRGDVIVQLDCIVGEVMNALERMKIVGETMVILTSDNGAVLNDGYGDGSVKMNGSHRPSGPYKGGKYDAFEGGTRVPFIVRWPGRVKPGVSDALMCQIDFPASLAKLTDQHLPEGAAPDSLDMLAPLLGETSKGRQYLVEEGVRAMGFRDGEWKLVRPNDSKGVGGHKMQTVGHSLLFNLAIDPGETVDLSAKDPKRLQAMKERIERILGGAKE